MSENQWWRKWKIGIHTQIRITTKSEPLLQGHLLPMPSLVDVLFRVRQLSCLQNDRTNERMTENDHITSALLADVTTDIVIMPLWTRLAGDTIMFSTCPFVRPSVCYQTCEHDIRKPHEPILMPTGTSGPGGKGVKRSTLGSEGQRSRSHSAEDRFINLAEASFCRFLFYKQTLQRDSVFQFLFARWRYSVREPAL